MANRKLTSGPGTLMAMELQPSLRTGMLPCTHGNDKLTIHVCKAIGC